MKFTSYRVETGQILAVHSATSIDNIRLGDGISYLLGEYEGQKNYVESGVVVPMPPKPTETSRFDYATKTWVDNINRLKDILLLSVADKYAKVCDGKDPSTGKDIYVDCLTANETFRMNAGQIAATNMDAGVRIFELLGASYMPVVRNFYNENYVNVSIQDARSIALQQGADAITYWQRKGELVDQINACTTVSELESIEITFNVNVV